MERVLVVPRSVLFDGSGPHGFVPIDATGVEDRWLRRIALHGRFEPRPVVEQDCSLKQVIPYSVLSQGHHVLLLRRLEGVGEQRLKHLYSIGVGGHINPSDGAQDPLVAAALREIREEVSLEKATVGVVGFVNDDTNPVGAVHFGVVFRVTVEGRPPASLEPDQLEAAMVPVDELRERFRRSPQSFETWSALLLRDWDILQATAPSRVWTIP